MSTEFENNNVNAPQALTLVQFNSIIKGLLRNSEVINRWVIAETSDVRVSGGHCYLELLQKDEKTGRTLAKMRAVMWNYQYQSIDSNFFTVTGKHIESNMKVMAQVSVNFHEQYGMSVVISAINPEFTLGDMARKRQEILDRLTKEGIIAQNKNLVNDWLEASPYAVPQRIAIVSAAGAAGYGDFMKQLRDGNKYGLVFYPCLFAATMQGVNTVPTVMAALDRVLQYKDMFDCVAIIRGGGGTEELNSFDDYDLAAKVAQFPLPVIVGIGHERDVTVLDYVAGVRVKTPTAAAEYIIQCGTNALAHFDELSNAVVTIARDYIARCNEQLAYYASNIPLAAKHVLETSRLNIKGFADTIPLHVRNRINGEHSVLDRQKDALKNAAAQLMLKEKMRIEALADKVDLLSPMKVLDRGYTLTMCNGKIITSPEEAQEGAMLTTHFRGGKVRSTVNQVIRNK